MKAYLGAARNERPTRRRYELPDLCDDIAAVFMWLALYGVIALLFIHGWRAHG